MSINYQLTNLELNKKLELIFEKDYFFYYATTILRDFHKVRTREINLDQELDTLNSPPIYYFNSILKLIQDSLNPEFGRAEADRILYMLLRDNYYDDITVKQLFFIKSFYYFYISNNWTDFSELYFYFTNNSKNIVSSYITRNMLLELFEHNDYDDWVNSFGSNLSDDNLKNNFYDMIFLWAKYENLYKTIL